VKGTTCAPLAAWSGGLAAERHHAVQGFATDWAYRPRRQAQQLSAPRSVALKLSTGRAAKVLSMGSVAGIGDGLDLKSRRLRVCGFESHASLQPGDSPGFAGESATRPSAGDGHYTRFSLLSVVEGKGVLGQGQSRKSATRLRACRHRHRALA